MSLHETIKPKCSFKDLVLPDSVSAEIKKILEDHEYQEPLIENGLSVRKKILLHGPPGCGKTSIAHAIANELGMKLHCMSCAQVIGSHTGESARNVDTAIQFAIQNRVVYLMDEFDSLASKRLDPSSAADKNDNHLTNTLLTKLEQNAPLGVLVAATNMFSSIDGAVIRRFDVIIEVPPASREALKIIADNVIKGRFGITAEEILSESATPSDVIRVANDRLRTAVIEKHKSDHKKIMKALKKGQLSMLVGKNEEKEA